LDMSDLVLLEQWVAHRDAEAFAELVRRHVSMVYATCRRVLGSEAGAEDVAQECFAEVVQLASASRVEVSLGGWLHTMATRAALKRLRSEARRRKREQEYTAQSQLHTQTELDDVQPYLDEAIAALPAKLRVPLVVHFLEGKTHQEVADMLGLPRTTVTSRVAKGVYEVRGHLKRRGVVIGTSALTLALIGESAQAVPPALTATLGKMALLGQSAAPAVQIASHMFTLANIGGKLMSAKTVIVMTVLAFVAGSYVVSQATTQSPEINTDQVIIESSATEGTAIADDPIGSEATASINSEVATEQVSEEQAPCDEVTLEMVCEAMDRFDFKRAAVLLEKASANSPLEQAGFHFYRGVLSHYQNQPRHALAEFQACEPLLPSVPDEYMRYQIELYDHMSGIYRELGDFQKAAEYFTKKAILSSETDYQSHADFVRQLKPIEVESQLSRIELDITDLESNSTVKGSINGHEITFLVYTDTNGCVLSSDLVEQLGLNTSKLSKAGNGCASAETVVDSLTLGDCTVKNLPFFVIDSEDLTVTILYLFPMLKIDAILGLPLLKQFDVTFDNKNHKLVLELPVPREEPDTYEGNFYLSRCNMLVPVGVNGVTGAKFVLSAGSDYSCDLSTGGIDFLEKKGLEITRYRGGNYRYGTGLGIFGSIQFFPRAVQDVTLNLPGLDAGPYTLTEGSDKYGYGTLGKDVLEHFDIHIDFQNMNIDFQKVETAEEEPER